MFNVSNDFLNKIKEPSRTIKGKVDINGIELTGDTIIDFTIESSMGSNTLPSIGGVVSNVLNIKLLDDSNLPQVLIGVPIIPYVAIDMDGLGTYEWVKLGEFYADPSDVVKTKQTISITAFDIMVKFDSISYETTLEFPQPLENVITDIQTTYGLSFATFDFASYGIIINTKPEGTMRQILGWIASLLTKNASIDENGDITFKYISTSGFAFNANNYITFNLLSDSIIEFTQLQIKKQTETITFGNASGFALNFENPLIENNTDLEVVYNREFPLSYYAYDMKTQGFPHLQVGDIVSFTDVFLNTRDLIITSHTLSFSGGLSSAFKVEAPKVAVTNTTPSSGSTVTDAVNQSYASLMIAINQSSKLITGNNGGYVITILDPVTGQPQELVICDTGDINTAQKVWRWNQNGLGYSSTGYNSLDYEIAITAEGQIVADFITVGILNADIIKAGVLRSADGMSEINMTDGTFSFGGGRLRWTGTDELVFGTESGQQNISISNEEINFLYNGYSTAYINQQKMFITNLEVTNETIMGVHKITKYNNNMTIVKYIG